MKAEQLTIRGEWLRRGISIEKNEGGKIVDYQQIKHRKQKFRGIAIQPNILENLGFNFSEVAE
ncbi:TPA: hypothetical protein QCR58_003454 [Bacillus cereus]|nr:hypothetical protein [Bacillus cereus]HDR4542723.1 hypothetical protein [Bacillus cereus]HDR4843761.1 hypothetical protein [Bacillus cereus]HDR4890148.1 hypothetical protein [Bacillus cereus]HDR8081462.1 hypothetical protein [Bacillus cereus]